MQKGKYKFLCLLLLAGFIAGIFVADVLATHSSSGRADTGYAAMESPVEGTFLKRSNSSEDFSIYTLKFALPFAAVAAIVVALSIYAFYSDRRGKRQD
jgi:hypothetical protein